MVEHKLDLALEADESHLGQKVCLDMVIGCTIFFYHYSMAWVRSCDSKSVSKPRECIVVIYQASIHMLFFYAKTQFCVFE